MKDVKRIENLVGEEMEIYRRKRSTVSVVRKKQPFQLSTDGEENDEIELMTLCVELGMSVHISIPGPSTAMLNKREFAHFQQTRYGTPRHTYIPGLMVEASQQSLESSYQPTPRHGIKQKYVAG